MGRLGALVAGLAALAAAAAPAQETPPIRSPAPGLFRFHSGLWLNLHHFLRAVARGAPAPADLTPAEKEAWEGAVAVYRARYAERDLVFDEGMVALKEELRRAEGRATLAGLKLDPETAAALERAAPVYRRAFWPAHDQANREWIAQAEPLVARHGPSLARSVPAAYGRQWPAEPVDVDLSVQAGRVGAYTISSPLHLTISPHRPVNRTHALELLFHEASHAWDEVLEKGIERAAAAQGKAPPRQLWHAVLFFTAGELTRRTLEAAGQPGYVDIGTREGTYQRACGGCRPLLEEHWGPRLDGRVSIEAALSKLVAAATAAPATPPAAR